jgi:hypothetical protein
MVKERSNKRGLVATVPVAENTTFSAFGIWLIFYEYYCACYSHCYNYPGHAVPST